MSDKPELFCRPNNVVAVPAQLKARPAWLVWRYELREARWTKVPYNARTGRPASSTDPSSWSAFAVTHAAYERGGWDGIGYVLAAADGFVGVDLDHCLDPHTGTLADWAAEVIRELNSYAEASPSGSGVRIFCRGKLPPRDRKKGDVEMYDSARFLTVTGWHIDSTPLTVEARTPQLEQIHAEYLARPDRPITIARGRAYLSDQEVVQRAAKAANGVKFGKLYAGDASDYDGDESRADLALCSMLAFWCGGDAPQIDRLFRLSGLMRAKWDSRRPRGSYGQITIERACEGSSYYEPDRLINTAPPSRRRPAHA